MPAKVKLTAEQLADRNKTILAYARDGVGNKQIGEMIGLHPGNVAKIIKAAREAGELPGTEKANGEATATATSAASTTSSRKAKSTKRVKVKAKANPKAKAAGKPRKRSGTSLLDAAITVLRRARNTPLRPAEIVERAIASSLWSKGKGKTPDHTLWARFLGEIKRGPRVSRVRLASPGHFGLTAAGKVEGMADGKAGE